MSGTLYVVPTPVGNLEDITLRAIRVLKEVDLILAEDTRNTGILLKHLNINKPLKSYHQHNEHNTTNEIINLIQSGKNIALVSDAGTPGISDPGFLLIRECVSSGINIIVLPGPTALIPALVASGLPCDNFLFMGFLPQKKGRQSKLKELEVETRTMVFYESPFRLVKFLKELSAILGNNRKACVSREISKLFEEHRRGELSELVNYFENKGVKGEIVIVVEGKNK